MDRTESVTKGHPEGVILWCEPSDDPETADWWIIKHEPTGITTQGRSRFHALLMLADALAGYWDDVDTDLLALAEEVFVMDDELEADLAADLDDPRSGASDADSTATEE